jgi:hypothetical protein
MGTDMTLSVFSSAIVLVVYLHDYFSRAFQNLLVCKTIYYLPNMKEGLIGNHTCGESWLAIELMTNRVTAQESVAAANQICPNSLIIANLIMWLL